jgi:hypothetical protein
MGGQDRRSAVLCANVQPEITATRGVLARTSTALMGLDDAAF